MVKTFRVCRSVNKPHNKSLTATSHKNCASNGCQKTAFIKIGAHNTADWKTEIWSYVWLQFCHFSSFRCCDAAVAAAAAAINAFKDKVAKTTFPFRQTENGADRRRRNQPRSYSCCSQRKKSHNFFFFGYNWFYDPVLFELFLWISIVHA